MPKQYTTKDVFCVETRPSETLPAAKTVTIRFHDRTRYTTDLTHEICMLYEKDELMRMLLSMANEQLRQAEAARVRAEDIEAAIADEQYFTAAQGVSGARHVIHDENTTGPLARITICVLTLKNGFTAVGVNEGPVSAENFKADLGREYARKQALEKVWMVLGYQLKQQMHEAQVKQRLYDAQPPESGKVLTLADSEADLRGEARPDWSAS